MAKLLHTNANPHNYDITSCLRILLTPVRNSINSMRAPAFDGLSDLMRKLRTMDNTWGFSNVKYTPTYESLSEGTDRGELFIFFTDPADELFIKLSLTHPNNSTVIWPKNLQWTVYEFTI